MEKTVILNKNESLLHRACCLGKFNQVEEILTKEKLNINCRNEKSETSLHLAVVNGFTNIVELLVSHKCDPNISDNEGCTPLLQAIENGSEKVVFHLLENKAQVNCIDKKNETSVLKAVKHNRVTILRYLIDYGVDVHFKIPGKFSYLHEASQKGHLYIVKELLKQKVNVNCCDNRMQISALSLAVLNNHIEVAKILLDHNADINSIDLRGDSPLHLAVTHNCVEIVKLLLSCKDIQINATQRQGFTPLHIACLFGNIEIATLLLKNKASVDLKTNTSVFRPLKCWLHKKLKGEEFFKVLLLYGANLNSELEEDEKDFVINMSEKFLNEIERMKTCKISYNRSIYDVIFMNDYELSRYVNNINLREILYKNYRIFKMNYPHYGHLLNEQFNLGLWKKGLCNEAVRSFQDISNNRLITDCSKKIISYLDLNDLDNLIKSNLI